MKLHYVKLTLIGLLFFNNAWSQSIHHPTIKKQPKVFKEHGAERVDDYYWLSNPSDSNVINYLNQENAYTEAMLKPTEGLQKKIYNELVSRIPAKDESLPEKKNGYWYYSRFEKGKQYRIHFRRKETMQGPEEMILDENALAEKYQTFFLRSVSVSPDTKTLAYSIDTAGDRRHLIYLKNLASNQILPDSLSNISSEIVWANDSKTLFYALNDHTVRPYKIMRHTLGERPLSDINIYTEKDSTYAAFLYLSQNKKYIFLLSNNITSSEVRYIDASKPTSNPVLIQQRSKDLLYYPDAYEQNLLHITTNDKAKNFKFVSTTIDKSTKENWKDIIAHDSTALFENALVLRHYYVIQSKVNGLNVIKVINRKSGSSHQIDFPSSSYLADFQIHTDEYTRDSIRYTFMNITTPASQYAYNLATKETKLLKRQQVGESYKVDEYETIRAWAKAGDGKKIPISIAYKKSLFKKDGSNPMLVYGYGSYGANMEPYFNSTAISLLDRGFVYAQPQIRGGQELGRLWYEDGKLLKKKNTFTDFIAATEFLHTEKYSSPSVTFANGGSAGGMLMGVVTNMRPDLYRGIVAEVPWMDVIADMMNPDLPLTTLEYSEWGDPNKKEYYDYMLSWSPMDNVKKAKYPAILATGGLNDTQVPYFSPAKWVAKIRENNLGNNPVLFKVEMGTGHGGKSGRYSRQELIALKLAFILQVLDYKEEL